MAGSALAAPKDADAIRLDEAAISHFAAAEFKQARRSLERALKQCKRDCSAKVRARLHRDLAVVLITGFSDTAGGERELEEALTADPKVKLDPAYTTDEVRSVFARVQAQSTATDDRGEQSKTEHEPITEQRSRTPVPIYVELRTDADEVTGRLHYQSGEEDSWHSVRMEEMGEGFGAEIPCTAVNEPGTVRYFVKFKDSEGSTVATAGSREQPLEIEISSDPVDDPPHFPDQRPPKRCARTSAKTSASEDCELGDEPGCEPAPLRAPRGPSPVWLSLGLAQDVALVSGTEVCTRQSQLEGGFSCFRASGTQYHGTPQPGDGGDVGTGWALAATRVYLASDIRLSGALSLGLRVGYAIAGQGLTPDGGKPYFPMHAEVRGQYWLSDQPFPPTISAFLFASGGAAQIDAKKPARVVRDRSVPLPPTQLDNPEEQTLDAYKKMGLSFAAIGAGIYLPFGEHHGLLCDLKAMALFPDTGAALELELGYALGL